VAPAASPTRPPSASLPFLPPLAPPPVPPAFGQPGFQPTATGASMARTAPLPEVEEGPPPSALRRYGPFVIAILGVSMLGLALGVSYLRAPDAPTPAASSSSAPSAVPSSPASPASARAPGAVLPSSPNAAPSTSLPALDTMPSGAPSAVRVGGSLKSKNPLDARH
jgi:hypothetical protein